jgi:outer membrane scaffolding protein for murein synthesis (MipA/OmpV family)
VLAGSDVTRDLESAYHDADRIPHPSPLQEWQYPGGIILEHLFEPETPKWQSIVGVASSVEPVYDGSHAYRVNGGPVVNIRYRDLAFVSVGEGVGVNLIHARHFRAGIALGYDLGRRESSDYAHLHGLGDISPAAVPKVFAEWALSIHFPLILRTDVLQIVRGGDGYIGDVEAYMPLPGSSRRFVMFAGPTYTFADRRHMQKMFGVTPAQSLNSGYQVFTAHGGSVSKGVGFSATLFITHQWLLNVDAAQNRLLGSASESPITQRRTHRMSAIDINRVRRCAQYHCRFSAGTLQISSNPHFSSTSAVSALKSSVTVLIPVAITPASGRCARASTVCTSAAAWAPIRLLIC